MISASLRSSRSLSNSSRTQVRNEVLAAFQKYDALIALMNFVPPLKLEASVEKIESREDVATRMFKSRRMCTYPL